MRQTLLSLSSLGRPTFHLQHFTKRRTDDSSEVSAAAAAAAADVAKGRQKDEGGREEGGGAKVFQAFPPSVRRVAAIRSALIRSITLLPTLQLSCSVARLVEDYSASQHLGTKDDRQLGTYLSFTYTKQILNPIRCACYS